MKYFDRYTTDLENMNLAYSKYSPYHLNLPDYGVTEEECMEYHNKLMEAQKKNQEKNKKRKDSRRTLLMIACVILGTFPIYIIYLFDELPFFAKWVILAGTWGALLYASDKVDDKSNTIYTDLFPPVNNNVERLFDDYLKEETSRITNLFKRYEDKK